VYAVGGVEGAQAVRDLPGKAGNQKGASILSSRYFALGDGKRVPLGAMVRAIRFAKAHPDRTFTRGLTTWWPVTGAEIVEEFRRGMNDRINQAIPCLQRGGQ